MCWIRGPRKVCLVAAVACCRQRCVVVIHVALRARHGDVRPGERECGVVVIERRSRPRRSVVTGGACGWKAGGNVIGIGCPRVVCFVAGIAISRHRCVVVVRMALRAGHRDVRAG